MLPSDPWFAATYHYVPNLPYAAVFCGYFGVLTLLLLASMRKWGSKLTKFMMLAVIISALQSVGFGLRIEAIEVERNGYYIASTFLLLIVTRLAFINYFVLGKLLKRVYKSVMCGWPAKAVTVCFIVPDLMTFVLLLSGGITLFVTKNPSTISIAKKLLATGLIMQCAIFVVFIGATLYVAFSPKIKLWTVSATLKQVILCLLVTMVCMLGRNIFRAVGVLSTSTAYVNDKEWVFGVFDTGLNVITLGTFTLFHFGRLLENNQWKQQVSEHINGKDLSTKEEELV